MISNGREQGVSTMGTFRLLVGLAFLGVLAAYLQLAAELTEGMQWGAVATLGLLAIVWVRTGGDMAPAPVGRASVATTMAPVERSIEERVAATEQPALDLPPPVVETSPMTLAERKRAKVEAARAAQAEAMAELAVVEAAVHGPLIEVEVEDIHVAEEFVVEVSADSVEDADIAVTVEQRRELHAQVRERIEARRRGRMAEIRAATTRMWEEAEEREDLVALLRQPNHGQHILEHPESPEPGRTYGAAFLRLDDDVVLKLRVPLDEGFQAAEEEEEALPPLPLPPLGDLPPLPALPVNPVEARSAALAALSPDKD